MQWIGTPWRSNAASTPACATPRAKPPPSASPIFGVAAGSGGSAGGGVARVKPRTEKKLRMARAAFMTPSVERLTSSVITMTGNPPASRHDRQTAGSRQFPFELVEEILKEGDLNG